MSGSYDARGVSSTKEDVHNAIRHVDKGLFPHAFCKIIPDHLSNDEDYCLVMHADGAGTKSSLAYSFLPLDLLVLSPLLSHCGVCNFARRDRLTCTGKRRAI